MGITTNFSKSVRDLGGSRTREVSLLGTALVGAALRATHSGDPGGVLDTLLASRSFCEAIGRSGEKFKEFDANDVVTGIVKTFRASDSKPHRKQMLSLLVNCYPEPVLRAHMGVLSRQIYNAKLHTAEHGAGALPVRITHERMRISDV